MQNIYVTKPFLPPIEEYIKELEEIWSNCYLTNDGPYVRKLEKELCKYLNVEFLTLFNNGTSALIAAIKNNIKFEGEIITTPFSFIATTHAIKWCNCIPVFSDIDPTTGCIDVEKIENKITKRTCAILPVQVYSNDCDFELLERISYQYDIPIIYDAAHAFGINDSYNYGFASVLSFHATKLFSTIEGGAVISHDIETKNLLDRFRNFGILEEGIDLDIGFNAKMNEFQAAFGLVQLKYIDQIRNKRKEVYEYYENNLKDILKIPSKNYSYFPILVDNREDLYNVLKKNNIFARKYFYPLISNTVNYCRLKSAKYNNVPIANIISNKVLCLPIYPDLSRDQQNKIIELVIKHAN